MTETKARRQRQPRPISDISTDAGQAGGEIVIKMQVKINGAEENVGSNVSQGEILDGSSIGDSPFCPDGTFQDAHSEARGNAAAGLSE